MGRAQCPGGAPVLVEMVPDTSFPFLTNWGLDVRYSKIQFTVVLLTLRWISLFARICGISVLKALEKSKKRTLIDEPARSRWE